MPPSATNSLPVQYDDSSEARNATSRDTSTDWPNLPSGNALTYRSPRSGSMASAVSRTILVRIPPGWTEFTLIPNWPSSCAAAFVMPRTANLLAEYAEQSAAPVSPSIDEMFTIEPPPAAFIGSIADFMPSQQPTALISMILRNSVSGISLIEPNASTPALLTRTSRRPKVSVAVATAAAQSDSLVTS